VLASGCALRPFQPQSVSAAPFLDRAVTQRAASLSVSAAVPDADETRELTGIDLYASGIQPVWLEITNGGDTPARVVPWSIDRDYFSPIEVAYMHRRQFRSAAYAALQRWFHEQALPRQIPAGETRSGFVFTHRNPGTKGFNVDIISRRQAQSFTFFVAMPGFTADYSRVDFQTLYAPADVRDVAPASLLASLDPDTDRYATDASGTAAGGPLNLVLVGSPLALRRALLRGGWLETPLEGFGERSRRQHYRGRPPDGLFHQARGDDQVNIFLALWLSPLTVDGEPVWLGQSYYWSRERSLLGSLFSEAQLRDSRLLSHFLSESVRADVDSARDYALQNFWYHQSVTRVALVPGLRPASVDAPGVGAGGVAWVTDGARGVAFLSEQPVAMDEVELVRGKSLGL
jgi:hypothetical protein